MKSLVVKRSVVIASHKTSVSLEDAFWEGRGPQLNGSPFALGPLASSGD
jgi:hypothetical protein